MAPIKFSRVISVSSEDPRYPAKNLLNSDVTGPWKCKEAGEQQAAIILQFDESCVIQGIDIGNENSAFVEIFVGKSVTPDEFEILRVASVLMSVQDAKNERNKNVVRFFKQDEFSKPAADKSWDRLKIICKQPFNKNVQYGLAFVKVHARSENATVKKEDSIFGKFALKKDDNDNESLSIGSFFAKRKDLSESVSAASAIRQASNNPSGSILGQMSTATKRLSDALPKKDAKKTRKNGDIDDQNSDGCRRSITGPLLYSQDDPEDEPDTSKNPRNDKNLKKPNDTSQTKKNSDHSTKNKKTDSPSTQTKRTFNSPSSSQTKKNDTPSTPSTSRIKPKIDDSTKQKTPKGDPSRKRANSDDQSSSQKKIKTDEVKNIKRKPFNKLLEGVVFVISGYQNPFRGELRSKALKMGAKYKADWDDSCTHLICAFTNTPKYNQVLGEGWIVRKDWIEDCHSQRKRLSCVGYKLDKNDPYTNSNDEEIWEGDERVQKIQDIPKEKKKVNSRQSFDDSSSNENAVTGSQEASTSQSDIYDVETDVDSEHEDPQIENKYENLSLKVLPALFDNKKFYLGTDLLQSTANLLRRYIIAYKGEPHDDVDDVNYIISEDIRYKENVTKTPVLIPDWIWECNDRKTLVSVDDYLL